MALERLSKGEMNITGWLKDVLAQLRPLGSMGKSFESLNDRLMSVQIELDDVSTELEHEENRVDVDAERGQTVKERVDLINTLESKHHVSGLDELLAIQKDLEKEVGNTLDLDDQIADAEADLKNADLEMRQLANSLSEKRKAAISPITTQAENLLHDLGMPAAKLEVHLQQGEPSESGADKVQFMFSANKGIKPQQLGEVASGGEFSRLMLAIKYLMAERSALPTIIFDEIDTGISGEVASKTGKMLHRMSADHQLVCITHLPQIAASGQWHYFVYKDESQERSISKLRKLSKDERITEIAQMISGQPPTEAALTNAKELLTYT